MKNMILIFFLILSVQAIASKNCYANKALIDTIPSMLKGSFVDDYGIQYNINDTLWMQQPNIKYHIVSCNAKDKYILAYNDKSNPSEAGLFTRIDYMNFTDMAPFNWGFCLTVYNAKTLRKAKKTASADRSNPKKGCGGYPFSRMMKTN